jgi:iron complex outermembrane receptor protein
MSRSAGRSLLPVFLLLSSLAASQDPDPKDDKKPRLVDLTLEELMNIDVTTASKKEQRLVQVPAAVTVIHDEDIRRTGARTIPDALRPVPGLHIAHIDANKWIVASRGFSDRFSNKLQVRFDGRTVYSPLFSGVFWETEDPMIEDIERIEVIRGPGGAVWGSNAVNGVINILSKSAEQTQGWLVVAGAGTEERDFAAARYGFSPGDDVTARVFVKYDDRDRSYHGHDDWIQGRAGFRTDWTPGSADRLTVLGEYYRGQFHGTVTVAQLTPPFSATFENEVDDSGGHVLARWEHRLSPTSELTAQLSYARSERGDELNPTEVLDMIEADLTHHFTPLEGHDVTWGLVYLGARDHTSGSFTISFDPVVDRKGVASLFVQDEISIVEKRLKATLGARFEYNQYTGFEIQPNLRAAWTPDEIQTYWASISRAVRMPARAEEDIRLNTTVLPGAPPTVLSAFGDSGFRSEELIAFELGHRIRPVESLSTDLALFYNLYDRLRTLEPAAPFAEASPAPPHAVVPILVENNMSGRTYGAELAVTWKPMEKVTVYAAYSFLFMEFHLKHGSPDTTSEDQDRASPRHQVYARASIDLPSDVTLDLMGRWVDDLPAFQVDGYVEADVRLAWNATRQVELAVVGQNLVHNRHFESGDTLLGNRAGDIQRGVYFSVSVRW